MHQFENFSLFKNNKDDYESLKKYLISLKDKGLKAGFSENEIRYLIEERINLYENDAHGINKILSYFNFNLFLILSLVVTLIAIYLNSSELALNRCIVENNYFIMEITRPLTNCSICKGASNFRILENPTKEEFANYAYSGQPMLVKGGCKNWTALSAFSFDFFKNLYNNTKGAYKSVEEECQFFPFQTKFLSLYEVLNMPESRAKMKNPEEEPWYIGWSNCNPEIASVLRKHYTRPNFLPDDSELSAIDWIFMGYHGQGASMHLDYVQRPSWQAQIQGNKTWNLLPPPECENKCTSLNITVHKGDIILIDTNQWYHTTLIEGDEMSITLGSEYD